MGSEMCIRDRSLYSVIVITVGWNVTKTAFSDISKGRFMNCLVTDEILDYPSAFSLFENSVCMKINVIKIQ